MDDVRLPDLRKAKAGSLNSIQTAKNELIGIVKFNLDWKNSFGRGIFKVATINKIDTILKKLDLLEKDFR